MISIEQIAISLVSAIAISAITSWITVRLALKQFSAERWWVRKDEAYTNIINALSDMVDYHEESLDEFYGIKSIPKARQQEMNALFKKQHAALKRATNIGSFIISRDAELVLNQFWQKPEEKHDPGDWAWVVEHNYRKARIALKELIECAKKDLRV